MTTSNRLWRSFLGGARDLDLAETRLVPALFELSQDRSKLADFSVIAVAPPRYFSNYAVGTLGPENMQGLLAHEHRGLLPSYLGVPVGLDF
jgi:hypothetical protein